MYFILGLMAGGSIMLVLMACLQIRQTGLLDKQHEYILTLEDSNKFLREALEEKIDETTHSDDP